VRGKRTEGANGSLISIERVINPAGSWPDEGSAHRRAQAAGVGLNQSHKSSVDYSLINLLQIGCKSNQY
jgi:hypothetical protein